LWQHEVNAPREEEKPKKENKRDKDRRIIKTKKKKYRKESGRKVGAGAGRRKILVIKSP
jgi:hypothetical protein